MANGDWNYWATVYGSKIGNSNMCRCPDCNPFGYKGEWRGTPDFTKVLDEYDKQFEATYGYPQWQFGSWLGRDNPQEGK